MDKQTENDSSYDELNRYLNDEEFQREMKEWFGNTGTSNTVNQTSPSLLTTPDPFNTAFIHVYIWHI